jgi:MFS family permease
LGTLPKNSIRSVPFAGSTIGGAIGPIFAGHIFDVTKTYQTVFYILAALCITGLILTASLKPVPQVSGKIRF